MFRAKTVERDLRDPLSEDEIAGLKQQLYANLVLHFPGQCLTHAEFAVFAGQLGDTSPSQFRQQNVSAYRHELPEILILDRNYDPDGGTRHEKKRTEGWHSDPREPGKRDEIGILLAEEMDESVAPTQWMDLRAAFAAMPSQQQERLRQLVGIHRNTHSDVDEIQEFHRPLVSNHPVTGAPSLDIHENTLWDIEGLASAEGRKLIDDLFAHVAVEENIYTHHWQAGDVVLWDNRSLVHRRAGSITPNRILYRIYAHEPESAERATSRLRTDLGG